MVAEFLPTQVACEILKLDLYILNSVYHRQEGAGSTGGLSGNLYYPRGLISFHDKANSGEPWLPAVCGLI